MKILLLVQKEQKAILDRLYEGIAKHSECDLRWLSDQDQANLKAYFSRSVDVSRYDRIVLFLRFKKELKQARFIKTIPNLVILEHDAFQNYFPCKYQGKFSSHYQKMPWVRILCSGAQVSERLRLEGFDAVFVSKGYDEALCQNMQLDRDIELGFVGGLKNPLYTERRRILMELVERERLVIESAPPGEPYVRMLNRIRFFVSADVGFNEYMIKNFEAMACGCLLLAYDQGGRENEALGFEHMKNIVLFKTVNEFCSHLTLLRQDPDLAVAIAKSGQRHAEENFKFSDIGSRIVRALNLPLRQPLDYPPSKIPLSSKFFDFLKK